MKTAATGGIARGRKGGRRHIVLELLDCLLTAPNRWAMLALLVIACAILGAELWIALQLANTFQVLIDSLAQRKAVEFGRALLALVGCGTAILVSSGLAMYVNLRLKMQARTALTARWLRDWLGEEPLYRLEREKRIDNPDQRIAEDLNMFLDKTLSLMLGAFGAIGGIWAFSTQLWDKGGALDISIGGQAWSIPGYLLWVAVIYSVCDLVLTRWIAKPQIGLNIQQQHFEADFRFSLVQVREHAEQVAFSRGENVELQRLAGCFEQVRQNWMKLIAYQSGFQVYNSVTGHFSAYFMYFLIAPRVLAGSITVGTMSALQALYGATLSKMNWLANSWSSIVDWIAIVRRLEEMRTAIHQAPPNGIVMSDAHSDALCTHDLTLALPNGNTMAVVGGMCIQPGERWLIRGSSGTGKSTLLRAVAGMWPHGYGLIDPPRGRLLFLPQKSYLPWDTLKVVLAYPRAADSYTDEECRRVLIDCRLPKLVDDLQEHARWTMRLSLGEQQRLAFARALLTKPDFLFLDESTSAMDVDTERHLYQLLVQHLPHAALVSVAHRPTLKSFHTHALDLHAEQPAKMMALQVAA